MDSSAFARSAQEFFSRRGFTKQKGLSGLLKHSFVDPWFEPGFHFFWRLWNPIYGFYLHKLFLLLGGSKHYLLPSLLTFLFCGFFLHDAPILLLTDLKYPVTTQVFFFFWLFAYINLRYAKMLRQRRWKPILNFAWNMSVFSMAVVAGICTNRMFYNLLNDLDIFNI